MLQKPVLVLIALAFAVIVLVAPSLSAAPFTATLVAAGDIADCASGGDEQTAKLLETQPQATVAALGDLVYPSGSLERYQRCYGPSWGRALARTRPALGNHDVMSDTGTGYFQYFGASAGQPGEGFYSYDLQGWHVVVLNSNCDQIGCDASSPQMRWLEADLKAHPARCTLAYWHHPRYSSGPHGSNPVVRPFFAALLRAGADVVLTGHDHLFERFAPMNADAGLDPQGIRQFVVGTGGKSHYAVTKSQPGSQKRLENLYGILELRLQPAGYEWRFVTTAGVTADSGSANCH